MKDKKIVLIFDICSSTTIIEDLIRSESFDQWRKLLRRLNNFLLKNKNRYGYETYKFIGDGWIILIDPDIKGSLIFEFIELLISTYNYLNEKYIKKYLTIEVDIDGLSFGMDIGTLKQVKLSDQYEYIGRSINIASRLQTSISQKDPNPANKLLLTNNLYMKIKDDIKNKYDIKKTVRTLKNISGGENYICKKVTIIAV